MLKQIKSFMLLLFILQKISEQWHQKSLVEISPVYAAHPRKQNNVCKNLMLQPLLRSKKPKNIKYLIIQTILRL